jgi:hypothetical protein
MGRAHLSWSPFGHCHHHTSIQHLALNTLQMLATLLAHILLQ